MQPSSSMHSQLGNNRWMIVLAQFGACLLVLLMPTSIFSFFGRTASPEIYPLLAQPAFYLSDVVIVLLLAAMLPRLRLTFNSLAEQLWIALCVLGFVTAATAFAPPFAIYTTIRWLIALLVYQLLRQTPIRMPTLAGIFAIGLAAQAVLGLVQVVTQQRVGIPGESLYPYFARATGMTFHPNVLAGYSVVGLLLVLPLLKRKRWLIVWWLLGVGVYVTGSRSAVLTLLLGMPPAIVWLLCFRPQMRRNLLIGLIGLLVILRIVNHWLPWDIERVEPGLDAVVVETMDSAEALIEPVPSPPADVVVEPTVSSQPVVDSAEATAEQGNLLTRLPELARKVPGGYGRWQLAEVAFGVLIARPLNGVGAGNFPIATLDVYQTFVYAFPDSVHNVPLLLGAEVGVLGGGIWLALALIGCWWLIQYWRKDNVWLIIGLCAWLALVGEGMLEYYPWGLETGRLLTMFVWSIIGRNLPS